MTYVTTLLQIKRRVPKAFRASSQEIMKNMGFQFDNRLHAVILELGGLLEHKRNSLKSSLDEQLSFDPLKSTVSYFFEHKMCYKFKWSWCLEITLYTW